MPHVKEIKDVKVWDEFLLNQPTQVGLFPQSSSWLDFQEALGKKVWHLGLEKTKENHLVGICGLIKNPLPFSYSYLYSPRGPVFNYNFQAFDYRHIFEVTRDYIKDMAPKERALFWCFEPMANLAPLPRQTSGYGSGTGIEATSLHTHRGRHLISRARSTLSRQPKQTTIVDLSLTEDVLCSRLHEKTRYNMRLALRRGVEIRNSLTLPSPTGRGDGGEGELEKFLELLKATAKRDKFKTHAPDYYRLMLNVLGCRASRPVLENVIRKTANDTGGDADGRITTIKMYIKLWLAYVGKEVVAGAIVGYFGDTATYLHGASSYEHRQLMAPNLLHWEIMKAAKQAGYKKYDFWGIDEKKWPGLTRFKRGFAGHEVLYPGTFDLPIKKFWYKLYRLGRKIF